MAAIVVYYYEILHVRIIADNFKHKDVMKNIISMFRNLISIDYKRLQFIYIPAFYFSIYINFFLLLLNIAILSSCLKSSF